MDYRPENILRDLHPVAKQIFGDLTLDLERAYKQGLTPTYFRPFEGLRAPIKQQELLNQRPIVTHVGPWQSPHQYGLAVDFVAFVGGSGTVWSWKQSHDWHFLQTAARRHGLRNEIAWDRPHVEHPLWTEVASLIRNHNKLIQPVAVKGLAAGGP